MSYLYTTSRLHSSLRVQLKYYGILPQGIKSWLTPTTQTHLYLEFLTFQRCQLLSQSQHKRNKQPSRHYSKFRILILIALESTELYNWQQRKRPEMENFST